MAIPEFRSYGHYSNDNYGAHTLLFTDSKGNEYYYSYETLVAFRINGEFHIVKNLWGPTTGKHLNWINPNKDLREDWNTFEQNLARLSR